MSSQEKAPFSEIPISDNPCNYFSPAALEAHRDDAEMYDAMVRVNEFSINLCSEGAVHSFHDLPQADRDRITAIAEETVEIDRATHHD